MRFLLLALLVPLAAAAQDDEKLLGAGPRSRPKFDGSSDRTVDLIPIVRYYGNPWFARTTQGVLEGGPRWKLAEGFDAGLQLAYEEGPLDGNPDASLGAHAEWDGKLGPAPVNGLVRVRQHLRTERGTQLDARATVGVYEGHGLQLGVFGQLTFGSEKNFRAYYGVNESGLVYTNFGLLGSYDISRRWMLVGALHRRYLSDKAAESPFVAQRNADYANLTLAYRF